jgi:sulfate/thiosulfate transport system substrate-binding protein
MRPPATLSRRTLTRLLGAALTACTLPGRAEPKAAARTSILNVSYDATRELYEAVNPQFAAHWLAQTGVQVTILQSHGGSGVQARAIIAGLQADVATLGSAYDVMQLAQQARLIPANWLTRLPDNSAPYTSTVVFLVRKGNPKNIRDWDDLVRPGVQVITPNPKSSSGARVNYLAAWAWAQRRPGSSQAAAKRYMQQLYQHVPVLDSGARGSTDTFAERGIGDVLIGWESEALLARKKLGLDRVEVVVPSLSMLAEPPVTVVDQNVDRHGTRAVAQGYLEFLYTPACQQIIAQNFFRPRNQEVQQQFQALFPAVQVVTVDAAFGGWERAQHVHFEDGGVFDQIYGQ